MATLTKSSEQFPHLLLHQDYGERRDFLIETTDLENFRNTVIIWLSERKSIIPGSLDGSINLLLGELEEIRQELEQLIVENLLIELTDGGWVAMGTPSPTEEIDYDQVRRSVNGQGRRSDILDRLFEIAGNLDEKNLIKELEEFLTLLLSAYLAVPINTPVNQVIADVEEKDRRNYPAIFFNGKDYFTGESLAEDDRQKQKDHSHLCLRFIRDNLQILGKERPLGLERVDWWSYKDLIGDFRNPMNFEMLQEQFRRDHPLPAMAQQYSLE